jgi:outer membrane protein assembly factor BamB
VLVTLSAAAMLGAGLTVAPTSGTSAGAAVARVSPLRGDLVTYDYDNARSGDDVVDPHIAGLSPTPQWDDHTLDGAVYGEPLVYDGTVYVATEGDSVYAINAANGAVRWRTHIGTPVSTAVVDSAPTLDNGCGDINPLGITGTPVIDPATGELFVAEETALGGHAGWTHVRHWLVAISLTTSHELWHRGIDPAHGNNAKDYYIAAEQQRPAITLTGGRLYVEFGGLDGDCGQYHGYVVDVPETGHGAQQTYEVPSAREGAIWGTGGAMVSPQGNLFVATGNGSSNTIADFDEGNAVVELSPSLARTGVWAPSNWVQLNNDDWDLGSAGPIQVPGTSLLFVAGKPANGSFGYLMNETHLGGIGHGAFTGAVCSGGGVFGADASALVGRGAKARIFVYAPCGSGTEALQVTKSPVSFHRVWSPSTGTPNGPPIVAGGLVWALAWDSAQLYGMNQASGHVVVERQTDALEHFATPGVGDGLLLVPTAGGVEAFRALK